jgi:hypothetical protein
MLIYVYSCGLINFWYINHVLLGMVFKSKLAYNLGFRQALGCQWYILVQNK